ncbi:MAG: sulfatase-like hydrolase/transferase [Planctomycetota bacterium]
MRPLRAALALALSACWATAPVAQNNVLILVADDLGIDSIGAYGVGSAPPPTPNIDALASSGVMFRNFWSNAICSPTRACIQTGRYSLRTLVGQAIPFGAGGVLRLRERTLPEVLDRAGSGYAHAAIGKWHLGDSSVGGVLAPNFAGWSHFAGIVDGGVHNYFSWQRTVDGTTSLSTDYATSKIVDDALAWTTQQTQPWVCYLSFNAPHSPFHAPPAGLHSQDLTGLDPSEAPIPFYKAMVEAMDTEIGRLLAGLGSQRAQTNVFFLADNGPDGAVVEPPFTAARGKGTPYEGGLNVPLIVSGPDVVAGGRTSDALVGAVDLFSTVCELAAVSPRSVVPAWVALDSRSLLPYLRRPGQVPLRQFVFAEQFSGSQFGQVTTSGFGVIRDDRYKLIRFHNGATFREQLYDLWLDPLEVYNLMAWPLTPEQAQARQILADEMDRLRSPPGGFYNFATTSCEGSAGVPLLTGLGQPVVGQTYAMTLNRGAPLRPAVLVVGGSAARWGPVPLPLALSTIGAGLGCELLVSLDVMIPLATDATGTASLPIPLPAALALVGESVFHTWLVSDPAAPANPLGVTVSGAAAVTVGL